MNRMYILTLTLLSLYANTYSLGEGYGADVSNVQQRAQNAYRNQSDSFRTNKNPYNAHNEPTNPSQELPSNNVPNYYSNSGAQSYMQAGQGYTPQATPSAPQAPQNPYAK